MTDLEQLHDAVLQGNAKAARTVTELAIAADSDSAAGVVFAARKAVRD